MISLLKLEFKKYNLLNYGIYFVIITLVILGMTTLIGADRSDGEVMFISAKDLFEFGDLIIRTTFTIFSGVLLSRLIIDEFKNSTIKILFTYPISRKKILGAKITLTWMSVFISIILESIIFGLGVRVINNIISITPDTITLSDITERSSIILYSALVTSGLSLISLLFGMKKKSTSTTIVASVILSSLINGTVGNRGVTLFSSTIVPVSLCIIGMMIAFFSYNNIDKKDIN